MPKLVKSVAEFDSVVATDKLCVIDAYASWCGPCKMISPHVEKLEGENSDVNFIKFDVDEAGDLAQKLGIRAMPTFIFFKGGQEVDRMQGANPSGLSDKVAKLK